MKRDEVYYQAMLARDPRFDGKFYVGVKTTGIYCRPICPAKPKRQNVVFFASHLEAERAGFRPCLRCRPESAPRSPAWMGKSAVVQRALKTLQLPDVFEFNEDDFANRFGITARHLRRLFKDEIGKTPKQLAIENRLNLARQLICETGVPMSEIAFASGFRSLRRFNDAFKDRFKKSPRLIRRHKRHAGDALTLFLPYRPPFDFASLMRVYESHRVGELEWFADNRMHRLVCFKDKMGSVTIANDDQRSRLVLAIDFPDISAVQSIVSRVRVLFDLDSDPVLIANSLETAPEIRKILKKHPGVRLPSGWDPFETAVGTILGQLVSVERGRALVTDLIKMLGEKVEYNGQIFHLFPTAERLAQSDLHDLKTTGARKRTLIAFAQALCDGYLSLDSTQDVDEFRKNLTAIRGIGPWTADYMALRVLRHTDAFPASDLILARVLKIHSPQVIDRTRPWRGYTAALLWREYANQLRRTR
jgi:AraC family transcriptional regulator of adaptative response / DNA-3-methyladenine glycosylase II